jgi:hypothetical protein
MTEVAAKPAPAWVGTLGRRTAGVLAIAIGLYGLAYLARGAGAFPPGVRENTAGGLALVAHATCAGIALATGPWQFIAPWRYKGRKPHRWIGRVYVIACLLGGLTGAALAWGTTSGPVAQSGFMGLAVAWLISTGLGWRYARAGNWVLHRRWMIRSFALSFAAVTLRLYLPLSIVAGFDFRVAYPAIAWLCWVPNLIAAELWLRARPLPALGALRG